MEYPRTQKVEHFDDYHGTKIEDPYRWLEDLDSEETVQWIKAQNALTMPYLQGLPHLQPIEERLTRLWDYEKLGVPSRWGDAGPWFITYNSGLQNHAALYTLEDLDSDRDLLIDPNTWSEDGTVAPGGYFPNRDGTKLAYSIQTAGTDWREIRVLDVATKQDDSDCLKWVKFGSASWLPDGSGFYYSRFPEPEEEGALEAETRFGEIYLHLLGTDQSDDVLIYSRPDQPDWYLGVSITDDGDYLFIFPSAGTDPRNGFFYKKLDDQDSPVVEFLQPREAMFYPIRNEGSTIWATTDWEAPLGRVIKTDLDTPDRSAWMEVIPQREAALQSASLLGDTFFTRYLEDAETRIRLHNIDGTYVRDFELSAPGTAMGFGGRRNARETFYYFTNYVDPGTIYHLDLESMESRIWARPQVDFDPERFEVKKVFYSSKDGTKVPMFVVHRKGIEMTGENPVLLYAYGGFRVSMQPAFSLVNTIWMEMGGVYAQAGIRGGGEYGEEWHHAGMRDKKQNVFDDFIAAAEWLIAEGYTSPTKIGITGGSNGGLLVGACLTQRPDLFGAVVCSRGVLDMLRFHKSTVGWGWIADYGCADDPEDFKFLIEYSPLHNIKPGASYPATLITTADHDDRVVPSHSYKFVAALQAAQGGGAPILIRIEEKAGHGMGTPTTKMIREAAETRAFLAHALGMDPQALRTKAKTGHEPERAAEKAS